MLQEGSPHKEDAVASFCTKCGAVVSPEGIFCAVCGAPTSSPDTQRAPGRRVRVQPAPAGSSAIKIILIVVAVLIGMGILTTLLTGFGIWRMSRAVRMSRGGVTLSTPEGSRSIT